MPRISTSTIGITFLGLLILSLVGNEFFPIQGGLLYSFRVQFIAETFACFEIVIESIPLSSGKRDKPSTS